MSITVRTVRSAPGYKPELFDVTISGGTRFEVSPNNHLLVYAGDDPEPGAIFASGAWTQALVGVVE